MLRENGADLLGDRSMRPGSLAVSSRKRAAEEEPEFSMKRPCRGSLSTKASNQDADANETEDDGTARCERAVSELGDACFIPSCGGQGIRAPLQAVTAARSHVSRRAHNGAAAAA
ncbi:hypothetical protein CCHR01_19994, partial [Colletotrichum chrysophilum]